MMLFDLLLGAAIVVGLAIYLGLALMRPERF